MSLSNSVSTLLIDPRSHSNQRTEYRLDDNYYASTLKLVDVGLIAANNPGSGNAAVIYPQINGVYQCISNIYLYSGTTLLDSVQNVAQYSAIQALKTDNQGSTDLNRDLLLNGMGFSQKNIGSSGAAVNEKIARPQSMTTASEASKPFSVLQTGGNNTVPPNNQNTLAANQDAQSGAVSLSSLLQFLKTISVLPRIPNLRLLIEWDTNINDYFNSNANAPGDLSVIRPTLVAEKINNMPDEVPDLNVPYMSTIVERFNVSQSFSEPTNTNLGNDPLSFTKNSTIVTVTTPAGMDLRVDEPVTLAGSAAILRGSQAFPADPITTGAGTGNTLPITVRVTDHQLVVGDVVTFAGLVAVDGLTAAELNAQHTVASVVDANAFTVASPGTAAAGGVAGGGAADPARVAQKDTPEYTAIQMNGSYTINNVAANGLSCTINIADQGLSAMPNIAAGDVAAAGGGGITLRARVSRLAISRSSFRSQAFTAKFVRELVFFNHFPTPLAKAADGYVTAQTRSPAQLNEVLQLVVNNVNHLPDQGISSEAMRVMYLNSAQQNMNIPYISMLEGSGDQRAALAGDPDNPDQVQFIYPYGALKNNFSITAAKVGKRVDDLRIEHQRTYGSSEGSRLAYTLLCFGTVARTLSMKNGQVRVSY